MIWGKRSRDDGISECVWMIKGDLINSYGQREYFLVRVGIYTQVSEYIVRMQMRNYEASTNVEGWIDDSVQWGLKTKRI